MKYLSDYVSEAQTKVFDAAGAFFAFGQEQYDEQAVEGVQYVNLPLGIICPKGNAKELMEKLDAIATQGRKDDLAENGKDGVILRELNNYECFYVGDPTDAIDALKDYGITKDEVVEVYRAKWAVYA